MPEGRNSVGWIKIQTSADSIAVYSPWSAPRRWAWRLLRDRVVNARSIRSFISFIRHGGTATALLVLAGCASASRETTAEAAVPVMRPAAFIFDHPRDANERSEAWWLAFGSQELNTTVVRVLAGNLTLASARARWDQLDAVRRRARGQQRPQLDAALGWDRDVKREPRRADGLQAELGIDVPLDIFDRLESLATQREWEWVAQEERLEAADRKSVV